MTALDIFFGAVLGVIGIFLLVVAIWFLIQEWEIVAFFGFILGLAVLITLSVEHFFPS